ncbi:ubiquitin-specific protease doa4 [Terramyces sp. JEL0728]|nr:ubiquitin-specific protease doa4 [Terramyces sp. JEL0728]
MKSISELNKSADTSNLLRDFPDIDPRGWIKKAKQLLEEGTAKHSEGQYEEAYILLLRGVSIVMEVIPKHKKFDNSDIQYQQIRSKINQPFQILDSIKELVKKNNSRNDYQFQSSQNKPQTPPKTDFRPQSPNMTYRPQSPQIDIQNQFRPQSPNAIRTNVKPGIPPKDVVLPFKPQTPPKENNRIMEAITCPELIDLLQKNLFIVLFDVREIEEYIQGHIAFRGRGGVVYMEPTWFTPNVTMGQLSSHLKTFNSKDSVNLFENVNHADTIVFYDFNSTTKQKFNELYDVLYSDFQNMPKQVPKVLAGGFQAWNFFVTNGFNYNDWIEIGNGIGIKPMNGRVPPNQSPGNIGLTKSQSGMLNSQPLMNQQSGMVNNQMGPNINQLGSSKANITQFQPQPNSFIAQQINRPTDLSRQNSNSQSNSPLPGSNITPTLNKQSSFAPPMSQLKQVPLTNGPNLNYQNTSSYSSSPIPNQSGFISNVNYSTATTKLVHEPVAATTIKTFELPKSEKNSLNPVSNIIQSYEIEARTRSPEPQSELEARFANLRARPASRSNSTKSKDQSKTALPERSSSITNKTKPIVNINTTVALSAESFEDPFLSFVQKSPLPINEMISRFDPGYKLTIPEPKFTRDGMQKPLISLPTTPVAPPADSAYILASQKYPEIQVSYPNVRHSRSNSPSFNNSSTIDQFSAKYPTLQEMEKATPPPVPTKIKSPTGFKPIERTSGLTPPPVPVKPFGERIAMSSTSTFNELERNAQMMNYQNQNSLMHGNLPNTKPLQSNYPVPMQHQLQMQLTPQQMQMQMQQNTNSMQYKIQPPQVPVKPPMSNIRNDVSMVPPPIAKKPTTLSPISSPNNGVPPPLPSKHFITKRQSTIHHQNPIERAFGLSGLRNLGNTCFMNSTIQCLSATIPLARYFLNGSYKRHLARNNPLGSQGKVADSYAALIQSLWSCEDPVVIPTEFKSCVGGLHPSFAGNEQQDSQEFLAFLLDQLHEDLNVAKRPFPPNGPDLDSEDYAPVEFMQLEWSKYRARNWSIVVDMFQGTLKSMLRCSACGKTSTTYNQFMYLTVPIPPRNNRGMKSGPVSLYECISTFLEEETLDGDDMWHCPRCKKPRKATKRLSIVKLPTNHYGGLNGGHYTAHIKNHNHNKWFNLDDSRTSGIDEEEIKGNAAYILYYARANVTEMRDWWKGNP